MSSVTATTTNAPPPAGSTETPPSNSSQTKQQTAIPAWANPDLTRLLRVEHNPGSFTSRSISLVDLPAGALFARITTATPSAPAYSTVQASRDLHIELNSDLLYTNHSCQPSLVFDMQKWEVRVDEGLEGGLKVGDVLTFFYPSTEWDMAQPFECKCGEEKCLGWIKGAKELEPEVLKGYFMNEHVVGMLKETGKW